jgi:hypothetical protein
MIFQPECEVDEPLVTESLQDLEGYEHGLDHVIYLQDRLREAAEREDLALTARA